MTVTPSEILVAGEQALADFRAGLTGPAALASLSQARGRLLIQLPVGAGKSHWLAEIVRHQRATQPDVLVVIFAPRREILQETRRRLKGLRPFVLSPRPRLLCGGLDAAWTQLEERGCGQLGRTRLCGVCPHRQSCRWPKQISRLRDKRLILAAQQHITNNPFFVDALRTATGARRVLTLIDESDLLLTPFQREITGPDLVQFADTLRAISLQFPAVNKFLGHVQLFRQARAIDLTAGNWSFPPPQRNWVQAVQEYGTRTYVDGFRFIGYDLRQFARSDVASRTRTPDGGLRFAVAPDLGDEAIIFSGSVATGLVRYRLDPSHTRPEVCSPFANHRFAHPDTTWYNLNNSAGADLYFPRNSSRLLDVFARLIARNIKAGKRTLLVSRISSRNLCLDYLHERLPALTGHPVRIVTGNGKNHDLKDPATIALITYGVRGVNRFEHVECCYCLNSFNVPATAVEDIINDYEPVQRHVSVEIRTSQERPRRRTAVVTDPEAEHTIAPGLAQWVFDEREADTVVQAVGRVRPFTRPREVITFQMGELPGVRYDREFTDLAALRAHFGLSTPNEDTIRSRTEQTQRLKVLGRTRSEIAAELGVSLATVKRYLKAGGAHGA